MNYYVLVLACILSNSLFGMQKVAHSEALVPGGKSGITSFLHILPKDVEEILAQQLIRAYPALFPPTSHVLSGHTSSILSVALTPDGKWALTGSYDNTTQLWDLANRGSSPRVLAGHTHAIQSVALTPDGKCAVTGSEDNTVRFWDLANVSSSPHILLGHSDVIWSVALSEMVNGP